MELMDPKLQLVTGCALVAFFSHTNLSLFNIHLSTPVHKYGESTSSQILPQIISSSNARFYITAM